MHWPMNNLGTYLWLYVWPLEGKSTKCVWNLKKPNSERIHQIESKTWFQGSWIVCSLRHGFASPLNLALKGFWIFVSPNVILTNLKSSSILDSPKEMTFSQLYLMRFCFSILKIRPLGIDWSNVFSKCLYSHALAFVDGLHKWVPINSIKFSLSPCSEVYWLSHWLMSISLRTTSMLTTPLENEGKVWLVL